MANGMILRGEIYWVSLDDSIGSEIQTGRPAVIISGDRANETSPCVLVAFITSQGNPHPHNVSIRMNGEPRRVKCDQIRTIAKERLTRYVCTLAKSEMIRVTGALATAMCIPIRSPEATPQEQENKEIIALKAECEMWKRSYDVVMTQLVELKVNSDLALRMARAGYEPEESEETWESEPVVEAEVEEPPVVKEPEPPKEPEETDRVEINTCSIQDLKRCGCTLDLAQIIVDNRPYMTLNELRVVNGVTSVAYGILKHKLCCVPVKVEQKTEEPETEPEQEPEAVVEVEELPVEEAPVVENEVVVESPVEKVNINTATAKELMEKLGINVCYAYTITSYRNKNGRYVDLEELLEVPKLPKVFFENYKDLLTIGEDEPVVTEEHEVVEEPEAVSDKVNVNTASAQEIHDFTGLSLTACFAITGKRNRDGLFKSLDELVIPKRLSEATLAKYRDKMTVGEPQPEEQQESDKVNVNTASLRELMAVGFEKRAAALIVNERKKFGRFRSVDDLSEIPEISGKILRKLRDKLEV